MTTGDVVYSLRFSLIKILPEPGFDLGSTAGESCVLTARLHMLYLYVLTSLRLFHYSLIPGHLLGWVFYYTSTNPVDFYVDIWRYTSGEIVDMVHTKQILPNPTGRTEVTVGWNLYQFGIFL